MTVVFPEKWNYEVVQTLLSSIGSIKEFSFKLRAAVSVHQNKQILEKQSKKECFLENFHKPNNQNICQNNVFILPTPPRNMPT